VDDERDGRLARLDVLAHSLDVLAKSVESVDAAYRSSDQRREMGVALSGFEDALESGGDLSVWIDKIRKHGDGIVVVLDGVHQRIDRQGIIDRFEGVYRELWRTQFLRDDIGPFSYGASWLASYFVMWGRGGNDLASVLERASKCMERGDIESAAREVNQVAGSVGQGIAEEWLEMARGYAGARQAAGILRTHLACRDLEVV
jgi:mitofilin